MTITPLSHYSLDTSQDNKDDLIKQSWRVISPAKARSQNYQDAFELRENEKALSFFVNSSLGLDIKDCQNEIIKICDNKNLTIKKNAHLIMIDLKKALYAINLGLDEEEKLASATIDNFPHCSFFYENDSYNNDIHKADIMLALYSNIVSDFLAIKNNDGSLCLTDCK